ncbi:hypothetical protein BDR05DRAFT_953167 [Suillus weaverae]|nr:hypothetical protein BDR05DRAFT_953167 [Suillus weaverae]
MYAVHYLLFGFLRAHFACALSEDFLELFFLSHLVLFASLRRSFVRERILWFILCKKAKLFAGCFLQSGLIGFLSSMILLTRSSSEIRPAGQVHLPLPMWGMPGGANLMDTICWSVSQGVNCVLIVSSSWCMVNWIFVGVLDIVHFDIALGLRSGEMFARFLGHVWTFNWLDFVAAGWGVVSFVVWDVFPLEVVELLFVLLVWFRFLFSGSGCDYKGFALVGCSHFQNPQVGHQRVSQWFEDALLRGRGGGNQNHLRDQAWGGCGNLETAYPGQLSVNYVSILVNNNA